MDTTITVEWQRHGELPRQFRCKTVDSAQALYTLLIDRHGGRRKPLLYLRIVVNGFVHLNYN